MLPALVLSIAIRAEVWQPLEKQGKAEWTNISINVLSSTEWTHRHKKVVNSQVGVTLKRHQKIPKFVLFFIIFFVTPFCPGSFSGTTTDTSISNIPLELIWPVGSIFVRLVDIMSHLGGQMPKTPKRNSQNIKTGISLKLLHRFQLNFAQWQRPTNALRQCYKLT